MIDEPSSVVRQGRSSSQVLRAEQKLVKDGEGTKLGFV